MTKLIKFLRNIMVKKILTMEEKNGKNAKNSSLILNPSSAAPDLKLETSKSGSSSNLKIYDRKLQNIPQRGKKN